MASSCNGLFNICWRLALTRHGSSMSKTQDDDPFCCRDHKEVHGLHLKLANSWHSPGLRNALAHGFISSLEARAEQILSPTQHYTPNLCEHCSGMLCCYDPSCKVTSLLGSEAEGALGLPPHSLGATGIRTRIFKHQRLASCCHDARFAELPLRASVSLRP